MKVTIEIEGSKAEITSKGVSVTDLVETVRQAALGVGFHPDNIRDALPNEIELGAMIDHYVKDATDAFRLDYESMKATNASNLERTNRYETALEKTVEKLRTRPSAKAYASLQRRSAKHKKHILRLEKKLEDSRLEVQGCRETINQVQVTCNKVLNAYKDVGVVSAGVLQNLISDIVGALNGQDYRLRGWVDPMLPHAARDMENTVKNNITKTNHMAVAALLSDIDTLINKLNTGSGTTFMSPLAQSRWSELHIKFMQLKREMK